MQALVAIAALLFIIIVLLPFLPWILIALGVIATFVVILGLLGVGGLGVAALFRSLTGQGGAVSTEQTTRKEVHPESLLDCYPSYDESHRLEALERAAEHYSSGLRALAKEDPEEAQRRRLHALRRLLSLEETAETAIQREAIEEAIDRIEYSRASLEFYLNEIMLSRVDSVVSETRALLSDSRFRRFQRRERE